MLKKEVFLFVLLYTCNYLFAQGPGPPPPPPPPGLPIDGGILLLVVSGAVYGINKLRK